MKEATGELSMTVVTIIAVIVIAAIVTALRKPIINYINKTWKNLTGDTTTDNVQGVIDNGTANDPNNYTVGGKSGIQTNP